MKIGSFIDNSFHYNEGSTNVWIYAFFGSIVVALMVYYLNRRYDRKKRQEEIIKSLRSDIFTISEKMIRYALHSSQRQLASKLYYSLYKLNANNDAEIDKANYFKYLADAESSSLNMVILTADLIDKLGQLGIYWENPSEIKEIMETMLKENNSFIKRADGVFNEKMTKEEIESVYKKEMIKLEDYTKTETMGKDLITIQKLMYPNLLRP
jgi:hypothetical protein